MRRMGKAMAAALAVSAALLTVPAGADAPGRRGEGLRPQIWFNLTNYAMGQGVDGPEGWHVLFDDPNARWPEFMDRVDVLAAAAVQQVPDDLLAKAFAKLKEKHLAFAMESLAQSWVHEPVCGRGVETFYDPPGARLVASKIKAAGGRLDIVSMDEPLWWGRYYDGRDACHSSVDNVAERAAAIMHEYQAAFPDVEFGDTEPVPALTWKPDWRTDYAAFLDAFQAKTGKPIAFLQVDINWRQPNWQASLRDVVSFARARHLPVGIIYNANMTSQVTSDDAWLTSARQNVAQIETEFGIVPDQAVFHSWDKLPRRSITDAAGPGEDALVKIYLQRHKDDRDRDR